MPLTSTYTTISSGQTDANSPLDTVLMDALRQNIQAVYESVVGDVPTYTLSTAHNHNGVNSAPVNAPNSSAGTAIGGGFSMDGTTGYISIGINSSGLAKAWEGVIIRSGGYRFSIATGGAGSVQVYRNSSAVGTLTNLNTTIGSTMSTDITDWTAGDLVQIYMRSSSSGAQFRLQSVYISSDQPGIPVVGSPVILSANSSVV